MAQNESVLICVICGKCFLELHVKRGCFLVPLCLCVQKNNSHKDTKAQGKLSPHYLSKQVRIAFQRSLLLKRGPERIRTAVEAFAELCLATRPQDLLLSTKLPALSWKTAWWGAKIKQSKEF
ncbi:MAG: hypothetical protein JWQ78_1146 [Sediminibacterium sp.]|nr:hypothetical protein [Sediminibacterium sp.]